MKANKETVQNDFREKYREIKIESNRGKPAETYNMGKQSISRQRYNEQRTRRDSQGRDFYEERKGRSDSRGGHFFRRYYRIESIRPRSFSRDMISVSMQRDRSKGDKTNEKRIGSKEDKREYKNCIGCKCEDCVKMRKSAKELNVQFCDGYDLDEEILDNYTEKGKQVMILDLGVPVSLAGKEWMDQYLKNH